jgi:hypothetical protein
METPIMNLIQSHPTWSTLNTLTNNTRSCLTAYPEKDDASETCIPADAAVFAVVLLLVNLQKSKKIPSTRPTNRKSSRKGK